MNKEIELGWLRESFEVNIGFGIPIKFPSKRIEIGPKTRKLGFN